MTLWKTSLGIVAAAALLTGCESSVAGMQPTTSDSSGSSDALPTNGAPKVPEPINDTAKFDQAPCTVLTASQLASIGKVAAGKPGQGAGPNCHWEGEQASFTITAVTDAANGLSSLYKEKANMGIFQPVDPIQGHPAVLYGHSNRLNKGQADLSVGVTDHLTYSVDLNIFDGPDKTQPDKVAEKIAGMMITTMKSGK